MKTKATLGLAFTVLTFVLLLIPAKEMSNAVYDAVEFCGRTVIPQLFLYLCLTSFVWELGIIERFIWAFPRYGAEIAAFVIGLLSGFPSGALISGKLTENGYITKKRGEYITAFSNNAGVSFVFGYLPSIVGVKGALSLFICQLSCSVLWALLWRLDLTAEDKKICVVKFDNSVSPSNAVSALKNATASMINICGFILFFSAVSSLFSKFPLAVRGIWELTTGLSYAFSIPFDARLVYCAFLIGFGGVCVFFQVAAVSGVGMKKYIVSKCVSSLIFPIVVLNVHKLVSSF